MNDPDPIPFEELRACFEQEEFGQPCDIAAPDATEESWALFLSRVAPTYPHRFAMYSSDEEVVQSIPADVMPVLFASGCEEGPWPSLTLDVGGLGVVVHFYTPGWIELTARCLEVNAERYGALAGLMRRMGEAMGVDVFLTAESDSDASEMVYEAGVRRFRRALHGEGAPGEVRRAVLRGFYDAIGPLASARPPLAPEMLVPVLERVSSMLRTWSALTLQDELRWDERREIGEVMGLGWSLASPAPGVEAGKDRTRREREFLDLARTAAARRLAF